MKPKGLGLKAPDTNIQQVGLVAILYIIGPYSALPAGAQDPIPENGQSYPSPRTYQLRGGVSHSESLAPIDERSQVGKVFKPGAGGTLRPHQITKPQGGAMSSITKPLKLPSVTTLNTKPPPVPIFEITENRYEVPGWIAGTWQRTDATEVSRTELPSGKKLLAVGKTPARTIDKFGSYRDKDGRIWQTFKPNKKYGQTDRGAVMDYHRVLNWRMEIIGRSVLVTVQAAHIIVNKKTRKVTQVFQDEELNRYQLLVDGKLRTDSSVKVFNGNGDAFLQTRSVSNEIRVAPFKETQTR